MNIRQIAILAVGIALLASATFAAPSIIRGITDFKTFLELSSLLNHCDGAGSPPPCHN